MDVFLTFLILSAPFALAALLSWTNQRNSAARRSGQSEFERSPTWPASGATGERR